MDKEITRRRTPRGIPNSFKDRTGQRFGRLIAQWPVGKKQNGLRTSAIMWLCLCDCGKLAIVNGSSLSRKLTKSCGCMSKEMAGKRAVKLFTTHNKSRTIEGQLLYSAADRARKNKLDFNLTIEDIIIPDKCPLLGTPINKNRGRGHNPDSPSLDRKNNAFGYVKNNVHVISTRANALKGDASLDEMETLVKNWKSLL